MLVGRARRSRKRRKARSATGAAMLKAREGLGWSTTKAAHHLTISEVTLWRYESGSVRVPQEIAVLAAREYKSMAILYAWLDECAVYQEIQKTA